MKEFFDYSMMEIFLTCRRKYAYRIERGLVGRTPPTAAEFGRCIHKSLDVWYVSHDVDLAVKTFREVYVEDPTDDRRTHVMGEWIIRNYDEKYKDQPFKVLAVEQAFELPLPNGRNLIGRIDKIIEWDGVVWAMDHKTTTQLGDGYMKMHSPNLQFSGYIWAAQQMGYKNCAGLMVDALLVAKGLLQAKTRVNLVPLRRDFAYRSPEDITEYLDTITRIQSEIRLCEESQDWYPNWTACTDYGECPYRRACKEPVELREKIIGMDFKVEHWDPRNKEKE